ncbi:hypothetical protein OLL83_001067 [Shewanella algae]|uniref:hypothetical protein n=1 Tax=Shewanella algae TaxID=38313 RepID=UPI002232526F|nr:hypothetical protein [Shewanella algae]UZD59531.1 hypothetical protein OLL83_001067 [Shewanella algae]
MTNYEQAQAAIEALNKGKAGIRALISEMRPGESVQWLEMVVRAATAVLTEQQAKSAACQSILIQLKEHGLSVSDLEGGRK